MSVQHEAIRRYRSVATVATLLTFILIILGAAVRVFDAGVSCPDWPTCYGHLFPFPAPAGGYVDEHGAMFAMHQVFLEWFHRLTASVVGLVLLVAVYLAWRARQVNRRPWLCGLAALVALAIQVKLGGVTVWQDNVNWSVALHLGMALVFYSILQLGIMAASRPAQSAPTPAQPLTVALWGMSLLMVYVTMLMGAMVSSSYAGGVCGGLFSCEGRWWPSADALQMLHMGHRYAVTLTLLTIAALFMNTRTAAAPLRKSANVLVVFVAMQVAFGILVLYSFSHYGQFYRLLSVWHLAWATVVFTVALTGLVKCFWGPKDATVKVLPIHP